MLITNRNYYQQKGNKTTLEAGTLLLADFFVTVLRPSCYAIPKERANLKEKREMPRITQGKWTALYNDGLHGFT